MPYRFALGFVGAGATTEASIIMPHVSVHLQPEQVASCSFRVSRSMENRHLSFIVRMWMKSWRTVQSELPDSRSCIAQVGDIVRMLDAKKVWSLRNKYATLRPTGWRSDPGTVVPAKCGPHAVLSSLASPVASSIDIMLLTGEMYSSPLVVLRLLSHSVAAEFVIISVEPVDSLPRVNMRAVHTGRRLWQYATQAVLMDAQHSEWPSARALVEWRERRRRYIALYQRKLAALKHSASSSNLQKQVAAYHIRP